MQVLITEEMAEKFTPAAKGGAKSSTGRGESSDGRLPSSDVGESKSVDIERDSREDVLEELAKACKRQGNFQLACKKYTQVVTLR